MINHYLYSSVSLNFIGILGLYTSTNKNITQIIYIKYTFKKLMTCHIDVVGSITIIDL